MQRFLLRAALYLLALPAFSQTKIDYNTQIRNKPITYGTTLPSSCTAVQTGNFFMVTVGTTLYVCDGAHYVPFNVNISSEPINVLTIGLVNDGVFDNTSAISAAFALNRSLYFPDGDYKIVGQWAINGYSETATFSAHARLMYVPPVDHNATLMLIQNSNGAVFDNMQIDYTVAQTAPCIFTGYCGTTVAIQFSDNVVFNHLRINQAQALAMVAAGCQNLTLNDTYIGPSVGTIYTGNGNLHINGFSCPVVTWDDCLNVTSQTAPVAGKVGSFLQGIYSFNSWGRGIYIGTAEVTLTNFDIIAPQVDGLTIENSSLGGQTDPPARISISNGTIRSVRNTGHATSPGASKSCIYIQSDLAGNNVGDIAITNVQCAAPDGAGVNTFTPLNPLAGYLSITNMQVSGAGQSTDPSIVGTCFHILGFTGFFGSNNTCNGAKGAGYYIDGYSVGQASIQGGNLFNTNTLEDSNTAIWLVNLRNYNVGGVSILDTRNPSASWILKSTGTLTWGVFHDINFNVLFPGTTHHPTLAIDSNRNSFTNITPGIFLAGAGTASIPGNGSNFPCADCDTPASPGATCSAVGDQAGAQLIVARGVRKCY